MSKTFFTSDHHFGHDKILRHCAETRAYRSVEAMNEDYWLKWNAVVGPDDEVWYLGDFSMKFTFVEQFAAELNGRKHLVVGNHDKCFKTMDKQQVDRYLACGFVSVEPSDLVELEGLCFALCHFPYRVPEGQLSSDPRIADREFRYAARSLVSGQQGEVALLHGHIHQHWRGQKKPGRLPEVNVGVDAWNGAPVCGETLVATFRDIQGRGEDGTLGIYENWLPA